MKNKVFLFLLPNINNESYCLLNIFNMPSATWGVLHGLFCLISIKPLPVFLPGECPWTEEPGGLQSMRSKRIWHDWATNIVSSGNRTVFCRSSGGQSLKPGCLQRWGPWEALGGWCGSVGRVLSCLFLHLVFADLWPHHSVSLSVLPWLSPLLPVSLFCVCPTRMVVTGFRTHQIIQHGLISRAFTEIQLRRSFPQIRSHSQVLEHGHTFSGGTL